jgi:chaperonin GroES
MVVKVGDVILFGEYSGQKFKYEDNDYLLMNEKDVIGVIDG